ncbi:hypothetical protein psyc5s11_19040 [Clostridium gelidum]|uniref:SET and RING associated domain-containing protein n=1 Tax=Clostridium gelidum TaxID=704125 RepID=A0ABN6IUZ8_9CLOT|nr:hypothetical protein [Clostridium gelidum]BCZ45837.1 hypothetical protein psyc5s11_19040 [Clostridium gelidum]
MGEISKSEFITRQFQRTHNKRFENYVLTRIWHGINSTDIKMITQQYVIRDDGCALLDAYLPQFNIGIEVDEAQHKIESHVKADSQSEKDVIQAIGCQIYRVDVTVGIDDIHKQCDEIISIIKNKMKYSEFESWDIEEEYSPERYIKKGFISLEDNAAFRKQTEALKCFGIYYKSSWTGGENHPTYDDVFIWFPKMHARKEWINILVENETIIYETNEDSIKNKEFVDKWINQKRNIRYVFTYAKDSLGMVLYRFKGVFELDKEATIHENRAVWKRTGDTVKTIDQVLKGNKA